MTDNNQKLISEELRIISKSGAYDALLRPIAYALSFLTSVVLAKTVGAGAIGAVGVGLSILMIVQLLPGLGLNLGVLRKGGHYIGAGDYLNVARLVRLSCFFTFSASALTSIIYFTLLRTIAYPLLVKSVGAIYVFDSLMVVFPLISLIPILQASFTVLQQNYKVTVLDQIVRNVFRLLVTIALVAFVSHVAALLVGTIAGVIGATVILIYVLRKDLKRLNSKLTTYDDKEEDIPIKELLFYSAPLALVPFLTTASRELDLWIVGYIVSPHDAGVYAIVRVLGSIMLIPLIVFGELFAVSIAKMIRKDNKIGIDKIFGLSAKWIGQLSGIGFVIIFCLSEDILRIFGPEFAAGSTALKIFAFAQLCQSIFGPTGTILLMFDKRKLLVINGLIMLVMNLVISIYMTSLWGMIGAAISIAVTYVIIQIMVLVEVTMLLNIRPGSILDYCKRISVILLAGGVVTLCSLALTDAAYIIRLVVCTLSGISTYAALAFTVEKWTQEEKSVLQL